MKKHNTVLIGCGAISKKHIEAIQQNADTYDIVGVFDIDREKAAATAGETGAAAFTDMNEMAEALSPDVAAIATPSALHADQAIFWMERGAHVVLEKPIALSTTDINRIKEAAARTNRTVVLS